MKNSCRTRAGRRSARDHCAKRSGNTCKSNEGRNERTSSVLVSYRPEAGAPRRQCRSQIPPCALTFPSSAVATPNPYPARSAMPLRENSARRGPTMLSEDERHGGSGWGTRCNEIGTSENRDIGTSENLDIGKSGHRFFNREKVG